MSTAPATLRRRLARPLAALALAAALVACSDSTGPRMPFDGQWISTGVSNATPTLSTITLSLRQEENDVTGTGTMRDYPLPGFASELTVTGSASGDVVMLSIESPALPHSMTMQAILREGGDKFSGTLTLDPPGVQREFERF